MAFVRYEQAALKIGFDEGTSPTTQVFATNFTATDNLPLTAVRSLGFEGAISTTATGPIDGSWSLTYIPVTGGSIGHPCRSANELGGETGLISGIRFGPTQRPMALALGDKTIFQSGAITTYNIAVEPNSLVTADVGGNYYDCEGMNPSPGTIGADGSTSAKGGNAVGHGSTSSTSGAALSSIGFSAAPFNASYAASRGLTPIYVLGSLSPVFVMPTDPQETLSLQGNNLPSGLVIGCTADEGPLCMGALQISFDLKDTCNNVIHNFNTCGFAQTRDISLAENDVLRGNITIIDYNLPQVLD